MSGGGRRGSEESKLDVTSHGSERQQLKGTWMGLPYDWRWPTLDKIRNNIYAPGQDLWLPKAFGIGYSINLAHPQAPPIVAGALALVSGIVFHRHIRSLFSRWSSRGGSGG